MMRSQNEIVSMATKAARGAGHLSSLAEDMGRATLWLCENGFDGVGALIEEIRSNNGPVEYQTGEDGITLSGGSAACLAVCAMDGLAAGISQSAILKNTENPLMLLGVCAIMSLDLQTGVKLGDWAKLGHGELVALSENPPTSDCTFRLLTKTKPVMIESDIRQIDIADHRWSVLETLAARTYVPATAESRTKGAGAGLTDND